MTYFQDYARIKATQWSSDPFSSFLCYSISELNNDSCGLQTVTFFFWPKAMILCSKFSLGLAVYFTLTNITICCMYTGNDWDYSSAHQYFADVRLAFLRVNPRKATGLDGVPSCVLRTCADQLEGLFADIFNFFLHYSKVPTCYKKTMIIPVQEKSRIMCLNDYHLVCLVSTIVRCYKRLVIVHINCSLTDNLDPLQCVYYCHDRLMANAFSQTLHTSLKHPDRKDTCIRFLVGFRL